MGLLGQFQHDVLILSGARHAESGNLPTRWVDDFEERLQRGIGVWIPSVAVKCLQIPLDVPVFASELKSALAECATCVLVLSDELLRSDWLRRSDGLLYSQFADNELANERLFLIEPAVLRSRYAAIGDEHVNRFWRGDQRGVRVLTMDADGDVDEYQLELSNLVSRISTQLRSLRRAEHKQLTSQPVTKSGPKVFLANVTDDLYDEYDYLKESLVEAGINVVPKHWYPKSEFATTVRRQIAKCQVFVQLLSEVEGSEAQGRAESKVAFQFQLAMKHNLEIFQWRSDLLTSSRPASTRCTTRSTMQERAIDIWRRKLEHLQKEEAITGDVEKKFEIRELIKQAKRRIEEFEVEPAAGEVTEPYKNSSAYTEFHRELLNGHTVQAGPLEDFKLDVLHEIKRSRDELPFSNRALFFVDAVKPDLDLTDKIDTFLKNERDVIHEVVARGSSRDACDQLWKRAVRSCHGLFLVDEDSDEFMLLHRLHDILDATGNLRDSHLHGIAICDGPPPTRETALRLPSQKIDCQRGVDKREIRRFVRKVERSVAKRERKSAEASELSSPQEVTVVEDRQTPSRERILTTLQKLVAADFDNLRISIKECTGHVPASGPVIERATTLLEWVEDPTGIGLKALASKMDELLPGIFHERSYA